MKDRYLVVANEDEVVNSMKKHDDRQPVARKQSNIDQEKNHC